MYSTVTEYNEIEFRKRKTDYRLSLVVCWMMISLFLINAVHVLSSVISIPAEQISNISKGILVVLFLININRIFKRIKLKLVFFLFAVAFVYIINLALVRNNPYFYSTTNSFFINVLPIFIVVVTINDSEILLCLLTKVARVLVLLSLIVLLITQGRAGGYSMGFANSLTLPVILVLYDYYKTRASLKLVLSVLGTFVILILGSRGALIGIGVYTIVLLLKGVSSRRERIRSILFIVMILFVLVFYEELVNVAITFLGKFGVYSRTLYLFLNDRSHDSGRNVIYEAIIKEILNRPFSMHGIAGEYLLTNGFYAHNFVLELLCDFGVIVGGIAVGTIIWNALRTTINSVSRNKSDIEMMFLAASLPVMFVSGSIWTKTYFWLWIATILCKTKSMENEYER